MKKENRLGFIKGRLDSALGSLQRLGGGSVQQEAEKHYQDAIKVRDVIPVKHHTLWARIPFHIPHF